MISSSSEWLLSSIQIYLFTVCALLVFSKIRKEFVDEEAELSGT